MVIVMQTLAVILTLGMVYFALISLRKSEITGIEFFTWLLIWLGVFFIIMFPDIARTYARTFLFARLFDLLVVGGFFVLIVMVSRVYVRSRRLEKKLEKYVREEAIKNEQRKSKK